MITYISPGAVGPVGDVNAFTRIKYPETDYYYTPTNISSKISDNLNVGERKKGKQSFITTIRDFTSNALKIPMLQERSPSRFVSNTQYTAVGPIPRGGLEPRVVAKQDAAPPAIYYNTK